MFSLRVVSVEMAVRVLLYFSFVLCAVSAGKHDIYRKHSVHGVKIRDISDHQFLHGLQHTLDVDIWQPGSPAQRDAVVMVAPEKTEEFFQALDDNGMEHYLKITDVAQSLEEHDREMDAWKRSRTNRMVFQDYPRYAEIDAYMERIAASYPDLVTLVNAGPSYEGRPIKYLKISTTNFTDTSKPVYVMDAMMHAREWVTTPVTLYTIHRLVESLRPQDRDVLEDVDWIIVPLVNPDGYEFSHTTQRLWRKTRSQHAFLNTTCIGVDINRNFNASFGTIGVSSNPCSEIFPGPTAFSELETGYIRDIFLEYIDRIQLYNDIHSHGNYITFGFGNYVLPGNVPHLHHVASAWGAAMDTMKLPQAGFYLVGNSALLMYVTSGCGQDYATGLGIPFPYTLELPSYGYDFRVPPQYQDHINEETWQGIVVTARLSSVYYRNRINAVSGP